MYAVHRDRSPGGIGIARDDLGSPRACRLAASPSDGEVRAKRLVGRRETCSYSRFIDGERQPRETVGAFAHPHPEHAGTSGIGEGARAAKRDLELRFALYGTGT